ncbi:hypothetical protein EV363DRAFT_1315814 [Boletus edulis]|nr:hypothetical protein EV363DRAFT_1315814 [Boletus edulis]
MWSQVESCGPVQDKRRIQQDRFGKSFEYSVIGVLPSLPLVTSVPPTKPAMSIHSSEFRTALCFGLLTSRANEQAVNECPPVLESVSVGKHAVQELRPRHYQKRIAHLVFAQLVVLCICNATLGLWHTWKGHERSLALVSASRITCLVGLLIQLTFHWASPRHVREVHQLGPRLPGTQVTMFLATLWFPYLPFVLSVFLLCNSVVHSFL